MMDRIGEEQRRRNQLTRDCWELYGSHRKRVTELIFAARPPETLPGQTESTGLRLCVLGAGNCNDLDLPQLLTEFREIHLVDLDSGALAAGVAAQQLTSEPRIGLHGGIDLTGLLDRLASWSPEAPPDAAEVDAALQISGNRHDLPLGGPFDVVASVCLLSQLLETVKLALGETHPRYLSVLQAVRARHLRQVVDLCRPGGRLVIVIDFVSSDTCRELITVAEDRLPALAEQLVTSRNFFTGLNPFLLRGLFSSDPWLAARVTDPRLSPPWRWQFPTRVYAVCALAATRR